MRFHLVGLVLLASVAMPASAQRADNIDRRVDRLEQEMRAVQRRVFPGAEVPYVGAEIRPETPTQSVGVPATSAVADLNARVDGLEGQLRDLTAQTEQNANRLRQLEQAFSRYQTNVDARLEALEKAAAPAPAPEEPIAADTGPAPATNSGTSTASDAAEAAYLAGFRLWEQKRYTEAQKALTDAAKRYPKSRWASWASNLAGRAYLDDGKPVPAAEIFLANYETNPKGERAPDSLYFLGQALMAVKKPDRACQAYQVLQDVYGETMRSFLKDRLPAARAEAKCK